MLITIVIVKKEIVRIGTNIKNINNYQGSLYGGFGLWLRVPLPSHERDSDLTGHSRLKAFGLMCYVSVEGFGVFERFGGLGCLGCFRGLGLREV